MKKILFTQQLVFAGFRTKKKDYQLTAKQASFLPAKRYHRQ